MSLSPDESDGSAPCAAVDLGGTWIRAALVSPAGVCGEIARRPTQPTRRPEEVMADVVAAVEEARRTSGPDAAGVAGIGVGVATVIEPDGRLVSCPTLASLGGLDLGGDLQQRSGLPVGVWNDASCFAVGEWWMGAGKGAASLCGITLGTGIGLGIVIGGRLHRGSHGYAGEVWSTPTGGGVLEDHVSAGAIARSYQRLSGEEVTAEEVASRAAAGDAHAVGAFAEFGEALGAAVSFIANVLDPEVIVFGGSVSRSFELFREPLADVVASATTAGGRLRLERSALGDVAALLGAARLFRDRPRSG